MAFQTLPHPLADLVRRTGEGRIQLPDFQRGYVWDDERVRQLLVTIGDGHPLGVVLMLETGSDEIHFQAKAFEGTTPAAGQEPEHLVLDGQQRLTSLTQALTGSGVVRTEDDGDRRYFIDVMEALKDPTSIASAVVSMPASGMRLKNFNKDVDLDVSTREKELEQGHFPVNLVFDDAGTQWVLEWGAAHGDMVSVNAFINSVLLPTRAYRIPAIELDKTTSMESVTVVFEKVNQGGIKLTVFELLTAKFAGDKPYFTKTKQAFRLREDWARIRKELDAHRVLEKFENDDFLQAVTLAASSAGPRATTARKEDVLKLTLDDYLAWSPKVVNALTWAATFLDGEFIHTGADVPYPKQIVPLAVIRTLVGTTTDAYGVRAKLRQWFWCGVFGELYGSASETRFARDVDQVPAWIDDQGGSTPTPKTVDDAYFNESRMLTLRRRNSAAYKGIYALLMAEGTKDWVYDQTFDKAHYLEMKVDIHHIFPRAWCEKNKVAYEQQESVVNKTPLARTTNIKLSGNAPSVYRGTIRKEIKAADDVIDTLVSAHQIDPALLWADDFDGFFVARRDALCQLVESAIGKPVSRDLLTAEEAGSEQTESEPT